MGPVTASAECGVRSAESKTAPPGPSSSAIPHSALRTPQSKDPAWVRWLLTGTALLSLTLLVLVPVASVFAEAFADGWSVYWRNLRDPDTLASIRLTLAVRRRVRRA